MKKEKVIKPVPRIPKGEYGCSGESIVYVMEYLKKTYGFTDEDLKLTEFGLDYGGCYYEGDDPSVCVEWPNIY
jgi:hypothetical protein